MKIVVLIGNTSAPLIYFVNEINRHQKIDLLVIERAIPKKTNAIKMKKKLSFLEKIVNNLKFRIERKKQIKKGKSASLDLDEFQAQLFDNKHKSIHTDIPTIIVDNINSEKSETEIKKINPDLIIDHGTALLKPNIIDLAKLSLNLHWGLSPYYRGVNCTNQAFVNWDINNIGVTIHKLTKKIDGGDILGQKRIKVQRNDTVLKITNRLTFYGTKILILAIEKLNQKEELQFAKQDFKDGFLTKGMYWDPNISKFIAELDSISLAKMITNPSRGEQPIVTLDE